MTALTEKTPQVANGGNRLKQAIPQAPIYNGYTATIDNARTLPIPARPEGSGATERHRRCRSYRCFAGAFS